MIITPDKVTDILIAPEEGSDRLGNALAWTLESDLRSDAVLNTLVDGKVEGYLQDSGGEPNDRDRLVSPKESGISEFERDISNNFSPAELPTDPRMMKRNEPNNPTTTGQHLLDKMDKDHSFMYPEKYDA